MQREKRYADERLNEAAKELWSYRAKQRQIADLTDKVEEYRERYSAIEAVRYDKVCVQGGEYRDRIMEIAIKWADLSIEINRKKIEMEYELWLIMQKLNRLTTMQGKVLELYYIKGYEIIKIAMMTNYADRHIERLKNEALNNYSKL